jgi:hypothetical protein
MIFVKQIVPLFAAVATGMGLAGFMAARHFTLNPDVRLATNHPAVVISPLLLSFEHCSSISRNLCVRTQNLLFSLNPTHILPLVLSQLHFGKGFCIIGILAYTF